MGDYKKIEKIITNIEALQETLNDCFYQVYFTKTISLNPIQANHIIMDVLNTMVDKCQRDVFNSYISSIYAELKEEP